MSEVVRPVSGRARVFPLPLLHLNQTRFTSQSPERKQSWLQRLSAFVLLTDHFVITATSSYVVPVSRKRKGGTRCHKYNMWAFSFSFCGQNKTLNMWYHLSLWISGSNPASWEGHTDLYFGIGFLRFGRCKPFVFAQHVPSLVQTVVVRKCQWTIKYRDHSWSSEANQT